MSYARRQSQARGAHALLLSACVGLATSFPCAGGLMPSAAAEPNRSSEAHTADQCLAAYSEGQRARNSGQFKNARELLALCGGASCPAALHADCQRWLSEVELATPRAVFRVLSPSGEEIADVQLSVDSSPLQALDGRAIQFDPGEHWLEFRAPGYRPLRRKQSFVEGERLVSLTVRLRAEPKGDASALDTSSVESSPPAADPPALTEAPQGSRLPLWLGAGAAVAGAGGFAYFGLEARRDEKALESCSPNCSSARVDRVDREYLFANISLGVGVVGLLGAAAWLVFTPGQSRASGASTTSTGWELRFNSNSASIYGRF